MQKEIKQSVKTLAYILKNSSVKPDIKKTWIIDKGEVKSLQVVIDLLNDLV